MNRDTWLRFYDEAEPAVQEYLLSPLSAEQEDKAQTALGFDNDVWDRIMDAVWELVFLKLDRQSFTKKIEQVSTERNSQEVEKVVLRDVVYPMADMVLWDVDVRLQELGADMTQLQSIPRISLRPVSYGAAARRIAAHARISILNEEIIRKLREVLISYIKGVRTKEQVLEVLQRNQSEGGLGFELTKAELYLDEMIKFFSTTRVLSEEEYAKWYQDYLLESEEKAQKTLETAKEEGSITTPSEKNTEAVAQSRTLLKTDNTPLNEAMVDALKEIGDAVQGDYLQRRLQNLISTRLRGVRNKLQVQSTLKRSNKVGGLNLPEEEAGRIADIIEKYFQEYYEKVASFEKQKIVQVQEVQKTKIAERRQQEATEHEAWYKSRVEHKLAGSPEALFRAAKESAKVSQQAQESEQAPKTAQGSVINMQDIQAPMRLSGLAEELGNMTLEQFRRLSEDSVKASSLILQKLSTLKKESFDAWTEGVEAWRRSPLQKQYLQVIAEAFTKGMPVTELLKQKREKKKVFPTAEELGAIIELNSKINLS